MHSDIVNAIAKLEDGKALDARLILENAKREWDDDLSEFGADVLLAREVLVEETEHACGMGEYRRVTTYPAWQDRIANPAR